MDFNSLGNGSPFYILRQGEKPILEVGVVKQKSQARAKFPTQTPNIMQGMQVQQVIDVVATINGKDETFSEVPINVEIAQRGSSKSVRHYVFLERKSEYEIIEKASRYRTTSR